MSSSSEERCHLSDLLVSQCGCRIHSPEAARVDYGPAIRAGFRTRCPACDDWIEEGETIVKDEGGWQHVDCR